MEKIILCILLFFGIFAFYKEYTEHDDSYSAFIPNNVDNVNNTLRKLEKCVDYEEKTVKWRRVFLTTLGTMLLLFGLCGHSTPTAKDLILYFFIIFLMFYVNWFHYISRTVSPVIKYQKQHVRNIRAKLRQKI